MGWLDDYYRGLWFGGVAVTKRRKSGPVVNSDFAAILFVLWLCLRSPDRSPAWQAFGITTVVGWRQCYREDVLGSTFLSDGAAKLMCLTFLAQHTWSSIVL